MKINSKGGLTLLKLSPKTYKLKINTEGRRMRISIKFGKSDSEAYKNWMTNVKPPAMSEDDFSKSVFQRGIMAIHEEAEKRLKEYLDNNPEEKAKFNAALDNIANEENVIPEPTNEPVIMSAL
jgi:hypothetical protein